MQMGTGSLQTHAGLTSQSSIASAASSGNLTAPSVTKVCCCSGLCAVTVVDVLHVVDLPMCHLISSTFDWLTFASTHCETGWPDGMVMYSGLEDGFSS